MGRAAPGFLLPDRWRQNGSVAPRTAIFRALAPVCYDDVSTDGNKNQIFETRNRVAGRLSADVADALQRHSIHDAVIDSILVLRLDDVAKCSDFASLYCSATEQRRALFLLRPYVNQMSADDRKSIECAIRSLDLSRSTLDKMMDRSKQLFLTWRERTGCEPLSIEDTHLLSDIPALADDVDSAKLLQFRNRVLACKDDHLPVYCSTVRLGITAQEHLGQEVRRIKRLLAK